MIPQTQQRFLERSVARGAALLDKERPGWEREIDLSVLNLSDGCQCILGQLFEGYTQGWFSLAPNSSFKWPAQHGFELPYALWAMSQDWWGPEYYTALEDAWISLVKTRFDAGTLSDG